MTLEDKHQELISKPEIQFWFPIIATIISITAWGFALSTKIDLISYKFDKLEEIVIENKDKGNRLTVVLNQWAERLIRLEEKITK